ncbi:MAG: VCBS repeat-containing protein [Deltaproteobacteria bacterium]|nr:VCBS repeat-containing protein [Deltaproteobacteria bacterium]
MDNVANEPWCYRRFTLEGTAFPGPHGRFGLGGEPRFFIGHNFESASMIGWDGAGVVVEPQPQLDDLVGVPGSSFHATSGIVRGHDDVLYFGDELRRFVSTPKGLTNGATTMYSSEQAHAPWAAADVDGDGVDEVIVSESLLQPEGGRPRLRVMEWTDNGFVFVGDPIEYNLEACGFGLAIAALDADGDPYEDLVVSTDCQQSGLEGRLYLIRGAAQVEQMQAQISGVSPQTKDGFVFWAEMMVARDFDGDALIDLALRTTQGHMLIMRGLGGESWAEATYVWDANSFPMGPDGVDGANVWEWTFADIDGDGRTDILAGRTVIVDPTGEPSFVDYLPSGALPMIVKFSAVGDISGDGIDDLMVATADQSTEVLISGPP